LADDSKRKIEIFAGQIDGADLDETHALLSRQVRAGSKAVVERELPAVGNVPDWRR
jgi:hypothetical protein